MVRGEARTTIEVDEVRALAGLTTIDVGAVDTFASLWSVIEDGEALFPASVEGWTKEVAGVGDEVTGTEVDSSTEDGEEISWSGGWVIIVGDEG